MAHLAVCVVGSDRPGIVAAVTGVLLEHGCNLEDTEMAVLRGHFAMTLVVDAPPDTSAEALETAISSGDAADLVVAVRAIDDDIPTAAQGEAWVVSVRGADRLGIVHRVASLLAAERVNITAAETRVVGEPGAPVYVMLLDVVVPLGADGTLSSGLDALGRELGVECVAHPADADIF